MRTSRWRPAIERHRRLDGDAGAGRAADVEHNACPGRPLAHRAVPHATPGAIGRWGERCGRIEANAVVGNPKLILADEPTGNLDSKNGEEVLGMLTTLNEQGTTVLMVTHSPTHAARAHRIVNLLDGRVVAANEATI